MSPNWEQLDKTGPTGWRVAFFRNMYLGQPRRKSPTTEQLLAAFAEAGSPEVINFMGNGTVIFRHTGGPVLARKATALLRTVCGYDDMVVVRAAGWCLDLSRRLSALSPAGQVCLFEARELPALELPLVDSAGVQIIALDHRHAVSQHIPGALNSQAQAHQWVTELVGVPVTARGIPTMVKLAAKLRAVVD